MFVGMILNVESASGFSCCGEKNDKWRSLIGETMGGSTGEYVSMKEHDEGGSSGAVGQKQSTAIENVSDWPC